MTEEQLFLVIRDHEQARGYRQSYEGNWQDIRELVRPAGDDFQSISTPGRMRTGLMYDTTAPDACLALASGMQSYLMSPAERWFSLRVKGMEQTQDHDILLWLEMVADILYATFQSAATNFDSAMSEAFLDLTSYGSCCVNEEWDYATNCVYFRTYPLRSMWFRENAKGQIDTVHRSVKMDSRQALQAFGSLPARMAANKQPDRMFEIVHVVRPRIDRDIQSFAQTEMPFASYWFCRDTKELLAESGYRQLPYLPARWLKMSDEIYGRSPAMTALPDVRMINSMKKTLIKVAQKAADPPLVVPNDGFLMPLSTHPGSLIFKEPGMEPIEQLPGGERTLPITREILQDMQMRIQQTFHADWLRMEKQNKEMTAFEVQDRRDEKLRFLAPIIGRQQTELLGPLIRRTFSLLSWHGKLPPLPPVLAGGAKLKIDYTSPAAKAQQGIKALEMERFVADTLPLAQVDQSVLDFINFDKLTQERARYRGVSRLVLRDPREVAAIREQRQQQEQIAAAAQIAEPASKAMKNIADAQQTLGQ